MLELLPTTSTGVLYQLIRHSLMKGISHKYFNKLKHEPPKRFSYLHNQRFSTWQFSVYLNLISIAVILLLAPCKWRKKTELWTRIKASLLLFYTGTNWSAAVQPWTKKLKAWIPQPSREAHSQASRDQLPLCCLQADSPVQVQSLTIKAASKQANYHSQQDGVSVRWLQILWRLERSPSYFPEAL